MARLQEHYQGVVRAALIERFGYRNPMRVPKLDKIVLNMGVGEATQDAKKLQAAISEMALISGQKPLSVAPASLSPTSNCARAWRSAARSRCAAGACTSSWIV